MNHEKRAVTVIVKSAYGRDIYYPHPECPYCKLFLELTGIKTLTEKNLRTIKALGFEVAQLEGKDTVNKSEIGRLGGIAKAKNTNDRKIKAIVNTMKSERLEKERLKEKKETIAKWTKDIGDLI